MKLPVYARAAVAEVWLVDLLGDRIDASMHPSPEGYRDLRLGLRGDRVRSTALPAIDFSTDGILGDLR